MSNKNALILCLPIIFLLSACTSSEKTVQIEGNDALDVKMNCTQQGYYNTLTGTQVYQYEYNTGNKSWTVSIPELCVELSVEDKKYGGGSNDTVRDMYRQAGVLREGNRIVQNILSEDIKNQLIKQYPNEELYLEDMMPTQVYFFSLASGETLTGAIQKRWKTYLPDKECVLTTSSSMGNTFVDGTGLIQYNGEIIRPTENSPIEGCPSVFAYSGENRWIIPLHYPQGTYEFFAPKIEFTDR